MIVICFYLCVIFIFSLSSFLLLLSVEGVYITIDVVEDYNLSITTNTLQFISLLVLFLNLFCGGIKI